MNLISVVDKLSEYSFLKEACHLKCEGAPLPSSDALKEIVNITRSILFPGYYGNSSVDEETVRFHIGVNVEKLFSLLQDQILSGFCFGMTETDEINWDEFRLKAKTISEDFISKLPELRRILITDVEAAYFGDPAAKSFTEIILCYPAVKAISNYRIAHELLVAGVPLIPRMISEMAHSETGIDIHPGATIGSHFTIDHGTGVVIGETTIIGNHVKLYQGVTLGAKSFELDEFGNPVKNVPRHPIIEDNVIIYSNATILGRIVIGEDAIIGGNLWITSNVAKGEKVVQFKPNR